MTLMDILKQLLGSKVDEEVEITESTIEKEDKKEELNKNNDNEVDNKEEVDKNKDNEVDNKKEEVESVVENNVLFDEGWFNSDTGEVDESKIKNQEVLAAIKTLTDRAKQEKEQRMISDSLSEELKNYSLNVSEDTLKKVLDMNDVKIDKENKVVGVKEALEALKAKEPGFFKDKEKESNPLNEGFNPVEKHGNDNVNSFSQAFKLMEEIS